MVLGAKVEAVIGGRMTTFEYVQRSAVALTKTVYFVSDVLLNAGPKDGLFWYDVYGGMNYIRKLLCVFKHVTF